jgi:periplasmic copper chaperone A
MNIMKLLKFIPLILLAAACSTRAEVSISNAWVRENAPGQKIGAAYMTLTSNENSKLVYVEAPAAAGYVEIHSMTMNNGVMKMRMLEELALEANKPKALKPGGFHLMLFDLKEPLKLGKDVTFKLCFEDKNGKITHETVTLPIKAQ